MSRPVKVGDVVGAFGVQGWVKIRSFTDPPGNILGYSPWLLDLRGEAKTVEVMAGRVHGGFVVVQLQGVETRDEAVALRGVSISVPRHRFPRLSDGRYYWADLVGLEVLTESGQSLGQVHGLLETGANDVLDVRGDRDRLIPFVQGQYVKKVCLGSGRLVVDWDPDF